MVQIPRRPYVNKNDPPNYDENAYAVDGRTSFHEFECVRRGAGITDDCLCYDDDLTPKPKKHVTFDLPIRSRIITPPASPPSSPPSIRAKPVSAEGFTGDYDAETRSAGTVAPNHGSDSEDEAMGGCDEGRSGYNAPEKRRSAISRHQRNPSASSPIVAQLTDRQKWEMIRSGRINQIYRKTPRGYAFMFARICEIKDILRADTGLSLGTRILLVYELASLEPSYLIATPMDKDYLRPYERDENGEGPAMTRGGVREVNQFDGARGWPLEVVRDTQSMANWGGISQFWMDRYWRDYGKGKVPQPFSYFAVVYNGGLRRGVFRQAAFTYAWKHPAPVM